MKRDSLPGLLALCVLGCAEVTPGSQVALPHELAGSSTTEIRLRADLVTLDSLVTDQQREAQSLWATSEQLRQDLENERQEHQNLQSAHELYQKRFSEQDVVALEQKVALLSKRCGDLETEKALLVEQLRSATPSRPQPTEDRSANERDGSQSVPGNSRPDSGLMPTVATASSAGSVAAQKSPPVATGPTRARPSTGRPVPEAVSQNTPLMVPVLVGTCLLLVTVCWLWRRRGRSVPIAETDPGRGSDFLRKASIIKPNGERSRHGDRSSEVREEQGDCAGPEEFTEATTQTIRYRRVAKTGADTE